MKNMIFREIVTPLTSRIGTAAGAVILSTISTDTSLANELGAAIAAVLLIVGDLIFSRFVSKGR